MTAAFRHRVVRLLLAVVLLAQASAPGVATVSYRQTLDLSTVFCAPSGRISSEAINAVETLIDLANRRTPDEAAAGAHCFLCLAAQAVLQTPFIGFGARGKYYSLYASPSGQVFSTGVSMGPPLGVRAPPFLRKVCR